MLWQMIYARLRDHGQKGVVIQGLSGIDIALWDIKGKHFGVPVHQLLGGAARNEVRAYATGLYRRKSGDPLRYLPEEAAGYAAEGFRRREAEGRLRRRGGCRGDARRARGDRAGCRADGRRQPRLRRGRGDPARPDDRAARHRLVRGAGAAGGYRGISRGEIGARDSDRRRRMRVHAASVSATSSSRARWTSSSPTPARRAACPNARRSPTWPRRSASGTIRMSGAPALRSPHRCSFSPCCRRTRRRRWRRSSRCLNSTGPSIRSGRRS